MRRITWFIIIPILLLSACNSTVSNNENELLQVHEVLEIALESVDNEVMVEGIVTHVCSHSGRRCFIENEDGSQSIRVEAMGEIEKFEKDLMGQVIKVSGKIREHRMPSEEIDSLEDEVNEKASIDENEGETCSAELQNIKEMREWMKENGKDYYAIFYIDGASYEIVE